MGEGLKRARAAARAIRRPTAPAMGVAPEEIKPGSEIVVPAGADGVRRLPYRLQVTHADVSKVTGWVTITGRLQRLSGAPTAKKRTAAVRTVTVHPSKIRLATEEDGR